MNTQSLSEAELEVIEPAYLRLKPLRDLEADVRGWKPRHVGGFVAALLVTVCYGFSAAIEGAGSLSVYLGGVVSMLMWLGIYHDIESKRIKLVTASLRAIADELREVRKKEA